MIKNCYIHIPFCSNICSYCDFCKEYYDKNKVKIYLEKLSKEISNTYNNELLGTIYIGGGTPTCLDKDELKELFKIINKLNKSSNIEFTIEGNIESITKEKLDLFKENNINRISIGIESINSNNLNILDRKSNKEEIINKINLIRESGIDNINVDLIYALPNETIEDVINDLDFITSLEVTHISTYSLIIEDHTILGINKTKPINDELDEKMYKVITKYLKEKEFIHYEISNFSKENYESKHNLCYWHNEEYYGFGLGAASYINSIRRTNTRSLNNYPNKYVEEEYLDIDDKIEYEIILNLRLLEGINLNNFKNKYHKELKELYNYQELINNNLLVENNNYLYIPEDLLYVSNEIIVKLLDKKVGI